MICVGLAVYSHYIKKGQYYVSQAKIERVQESFRLHIPSSLDIYMLGIKKRSCATRKEVGVFYVSQVMVLPCITNMFLLSYKQDLYMYLSGFFKTATLLIVQSQ